MNYTFSWGTKGASDMEPIWFKQYQPGVAHTINPDAYQNLNAIFTEAFSKYKELPAFTNMGQTVTYDQVYVDAKAFASFLTNQLELPKGSRVAIMLPNLVQYPIAMIGILMAGCCVVNVNPLYTADEFIVQINDAKVDCLLVLENFAHIVTESLPKVDIKHIIIAKISDVFPLRKAWLVDLIVRHIKRLVPKWKINKFFWYRDVIEIGKQYTFTPVTVEHEDLAFLQYTGGTTGSPKGAMLTHRNLVANVLQASCWMSKTLVPRKEIIITALPLYHIFSLTANCLTFINYGALNVLITNPRDKRTFIKELRRHKFTAITGVNTLFNLLLNIPNFAKIDFSHLKVALGGGMHVQEIIAKKWQDLTHHPLLEAYGLTETSPAACINPMNLHSYNGTVGLPVPSTDISIRDENGHELGLNEPGILFIKGPQVMRGYWQQPAETKLVLSDDGWLNTGDIAVVNDKGFVSIVDRKKDLIMVSGFKVFPNEVENVIASMPGVKEVAVVAGSDDIAGEMVVAYIVPSDSTLTKESVRSYCKEHLTGYKIPKEVEFRDSLPKTNVGKILKRAIK